MCKIARLRRHHPHVYFLVFEPVAPHGWLLIFPCPCKLLRSCNACLLFCLLLFAVNHFLCHFQNFIPYSHDVTCTRVMAFDFVGLFASLYEDSVLNDIFVLVNPLRGRLNIFVSLTCFISIITHLSVGVDSFFFYLCF